MATVLPPEQEDKLQAEFSEGKMSPEKTAAWEAYLSQKPQLPPETPTLPTPVEPPPAAPAVPPKPARHFPEGDPRNDSPWYQQYFEQYALGHGLPEEGTPWGPPVLGTTTPGEAADARQAYQETQGSTARNVLEWGASLYPMTWPGRVAKAAGFIPRVVESVSQLAPRALKSGLLSGGASMVSNVLDPATYTPPLEAAAWNAGGEFLGGVGEDLLKGTGAYLRRPFQETTEGAMHRGVIEGAGGQVTPGMVSEKRLPQLLDTVSMYMPTGSRTEAVYDATQGQLQQEMKALQGQHPGGKVSEKVEDISQRVQARATPSQVTPTAEEIRDRTAKVIKDTEAKHVTNYETLDTNYRQQKIWWRPSSMQLPTVGSEVDLLVSPGMVPQDGFGTHSIFTETMNLTNALKNLPPAMTLDGIYEMYQTNFKLMREAQKHVDEAEKVAAANHTTLDGLAQSIKLKVLDVLGTNQDLLNKQLAPYLVDRGPAQDVARKVIGAWEQGLLVPETAMQRGQAGRVGVLEDPQVMAARTLVDKPRFGLFTEVHNDRQGFLKIGRMPGSNMDNEIAREANDVARALDVSMDRTGNRITPKLSPQWRRTNAAYKADIEVMNSPLMEELADKNLDDIINTFVQPGRINDMKTLRATLGNQTMDDAAQMWLTKQMEKHTPASTRVRLPTDPPLGPATGPGRLNNAGLLADLDQVDAETAKVLFPRGNLTGMRNALRRGVDMEAAVAELGKELPNVTVLQQLKTSIRDPQAWQAVQSDVLAPMLKGDVDPLKGEALLVGLEKLGKARDVLFDPGHLQSLQHLAHTVRALDQTRARTAHAPMIRRTLHGLTLMGLGYWSGGTDAPMYYFLGNKALNHVLANPTAVKLLTRGLTTNASKHAWGEVIGSLVGTLHSQGISNEIVPITPHGPQGPPETAPDVDPYAEAQ